jgi:sugar phosphate isomerase/epimerase
MTDDLLTRLVGSPCCLPGLGERELFSTYRALGFTKYEGFSVWPECKHPWTGDAEAAKQRAAEQGLRFTSYHLAPISEDVEKSFEDAVAGARFAERLGAEIVLFKAKTLELFESVGKRFLNTLKSERINVRPVLQNHAGSAISTLADFERAIAAFDGDPAIEAILEVGHFQRVGIHWKAGWDLLRERVALIHVNEIRAGKSVHYGTGEVDFAGLIQYVKSSGYTGNIVVELELPNSQTDVPETVRGLEQAIAMLRKLYAEAA